MTDPSLDFAVALGAALDMATPPQTTYQSTTGSGCTVPTSLFA